MMEQHDDRSPPAQAVEESKSHRPLISRHSKAENVEAPAISSRRKYSLA
jgi:hypothetical protein